MSKYLYIYLKKNLSFKIIFTVRTTLNFAISTVYHDFVFSTFLHSFEMHRTVCFTVPCVYSFDMH